MYSDIRTILSDKPISVMNWVSQWGNTSINNQTPSHQLQRNIYCVFSSMNIELINKNNINDNTSYVVNAYSDDGIFVSFTQSSIGAAYKITHPSGIDHGWVISVDPDSPEGIVIGLCNYGQTFGRFVGEDLLSKKVHILYSPISQTDSINFVGTSNNSIINHYSKDNILINSYTTTGSGNVTYLNVTPFSQFDYFECDEPQ